jgi:DNA-binding CsgD family transcriptional regulator
LLEGEPTCQTCTLTLDPTLQRNLDIRFDDNTTTIARLSCPTAPRFWKWRALALPKIVQREVHLEDEETHAHEWKHQLVAALLCGAFALAAALLGGAWALPLFIASYLCGSWFTAQEVWEHLQQRKEDVHFLMLTVALGSAGIGAWGEGAVLLFLFSFSGSLEHYAMGRTQREISALFKFAPKSATVLDEQRRDFSAFRQQAEAWRTGSKKYLDGLSQSIDLQLDQWQLSAAEKEVAFLLLKGLSLKEIAVARGTSEKTARVQSSAVYSKSGLAGRSELSAFFLEDLLPPPTR